MISITDIIVLLIDYLTFSFFYTSTHFFVCLIFRAVIRNLCSKLFEFQGPDSIDNIIKKGHGANRIGYKMAQIELA